MNVIVLACAACNGDPDSPLTKGAFWGILVLIGIIVGVMGGFGSLFLFWMRRAKALEAKLAAIQDDAPTLSGDEPSVDDVPVWRVEDGEEPVVAPVVH